ncbi:hypothetical protein [Candidatus Magnetaquicoccus inordinatus]|uniref:hypothetical protein n=1 Tax=Candidatus Magnetaquicoccus inordinatus TaxID=2496818 RepID=UPI00102B2DCD|nr:hypothetical protein [Candidatus Magnetaquicoccus inordinatus]
MELKQPNDTVVIAGLEHAIQLHRLLGIGMIQQVHTLLTSPYSPITESFIQHQINLCSEDELFLLMESFPDASDSLLRMAMKKASEQKSRTVLFLLFQRLENTSDSEAQLLTIRDCKKTDILSTFSQISDPTPDVMILAIDRIPVTGLDQLLAIFPSSHQGHATDILAKIGTKPMRDSEKIHHLFAYYNLLDQPTTTIIESLIEHLPTRQERHLVSLESLIPTLPELTPSIVTALAKHYTAHVKNITEILNRLLRTGKLNPTEHQNLLDQFRELSQASKPTTQIRKTARLVITRHDGHLLSTGYKPGSTIQRLALPDENHSGQKIAEQLIGLLYKNINSRENG